MESTKPGADFESIVRAHQEKVRNICFRFVNNREDADDLAQEVFAQVYGSLARFRREADLATWIYRIAVNRSLDSIRREKRYKRFARIRSFWGRGGEEERIAGPAGDDPERRLEEEERKRVLARAVGRLPPSQRTAITLSRYEGFNHQDIAGIMGLSLSAVEALIHRAHTNLRKDLYAYFDKKPRRGHGSLKTDV